MHFPYTVQLRTSKALLASVTAAHVAAALALFHAFDSGAMLRIAHYRLPARLVLAVLLTGIVFSLLQAVRSGYAKRGMVWILGEEGGLQVRQCGREQVFRLDGEAIDFGWALWLRCRPDQADACQRRPLSHWMLVPAELEPQDGWRALRIWVRHKACRPRQS
jgi:hypothetical protein